MASSRYWGEMEGASCGLANTISYPSRFVSRVFMSRRREFMHSEISMDDDEEAWACDCTQAVTVVSWPFKRAAPLSQGYRYLPTRGATIDTASECLIRACV